MAKNTQIHGFCSPQFEQVKKTFNSNFDSGLEMGASFCVFWKGECIVDLWAGDKDKQGNPWEKDTIVSVYSLTKIMTVICTMMLVERGSLNLDEPVAALWSEFGRKGKDNITLRQVLAHSSGVAGWDKPMRVDDICDWEYSTSLLAEQEPWWEPGTRSGYHTTSQGHILGELIRRSTGNTIGTFFSKNVTSPLAADFHIGLKESEVGRIGQISSPPLAPQKQQHSISEGRTRKPMWEDQGSIAARSLINPPMRGKNARSRIWQAAEIPAGNGFGNARSVAKILGSVAANTTVNGSPLLRPSTIEQICEEQTFSRDEVLGVPIRWGLGFALQTDRVAIGPNARTLHWTGWGGSLGVIDPEASLGFSYVMNRMAPSLTADKRSKALYQTLYKCLE